MNKRKSIIRNIKNKFSAFSLFVLILGIMIPGFTPLQGRIGPAKLFDVNFRQPIDMAVYPEKINGEKWFAVAEKRGMIYLVTEHATKYSQDKIVMMDLRKKVCSSGFEEGLLGLVFDPNYKQTRRAYIYYSQCHPRTANISRITFSFSLENNMPVFTYGEEKILSIDEPYSNHNGGCVQFGPDGYLYIGVGDGGSGGDPHNNAQNLNTLLGKILRLDVSGSSGYKIPMDNPFIQSGRPEIFAFGLRNPWRFTIDEKTGKLIVGDVGQNDYEEISIVKKGGNYGWRIMEGFHCFNPAKNCSQENLLLPVYEYGHDVGQSIIGGHIYKGGINTLKGLYIFGDYVTGEIWALNLSREKKPEPVGVVKTGRNISSFARDPNGEVYIIAIDNGEIYRLEDK